MQVVEDIVCASRIGKAVQNGICKSGKCAMRIELGKCKGQSAERRVPRFWGRAEKSKIRHSNKNRCIRQEDVIAKYLLHYLRCDIDGFFLGGICNFDCQAY